MWIETKTEVEETSRSGASYRRRVLDTVLLCTGDMKHLNKYMEGKKTQQVHPEIFPHLFSKV